MTRFGWITVLILLVALPGLVIGQTQTQSTDQTQQQGQVQQPQQDQQISQAQQSDQGQQPAGNALIRAQDAVGMTVSNQDGTVQGQITDFVLNSKGDISHVVIALQQGQAAQPGQESGETAQADQSDMMGQSTQPGEEAGETAQAGQNDQTQQGQAGQTDQGGAMAQAQPGQTDQGGAMGQAGQEQGQMAAAGQSYLLPVDQITIEGQQAMLQVNQDQIQQLQTLENGNLPQSIAQADGEQYVLASQLQGATVVGQNNTELGTVEGAMIDPQQKKVAYLAVAPAGVLGLSDQYYAVNPDTVQQIDPQQKMIATNLTEDQFKQMSGFGQDNWPQQAPAGSAAMSGQQSGTQQGQQSTQQSQ